MAKSRRLWKATWYWGKRASTLYCFNYNLILFIFWFYIVCLPIQQALLKVSWKEVLRHCRAIHLLTNWNNLDYMEHSRSGRACLTVALDGTDESNRRLCVYFSTIVPICHSVHFDFWEFEEIYLLRLLLVVVIVSDTGYGTRTLSNWLQTVDWCIPLFHLIVPAVPSPVTFFFSEKQYPWKCASHFRW